MMDTKSSDIRVHIPDACAFIDEVLKAKGKVLVHCMVGASRSVSLVLAWLVAECKLPLKQAFQLVRSNSDVIGKSFGVSWSISLQKSAKYRM